MKENLYKRLAKTQCYFTNLSNARTLLTHQTQVNATLLPPQEMASKATIMFKTKADSLVKKHIVLAIMVACVL